MTAAVHVLTLFLAISPMAAGLGASDGPPRSAMPVVTGATTGAASSAGSADSDGSPNSSSSVTGVWPLDPRPTVVAQFDPPVSRYGAGHRGVDLAGSRGQVVRAAAAGRVTFAGSLAGRGVVVVSHGATRTTYEPVHASVKVGAVVAAGERIGTLQDFGSHCWPAVCLHWGLIEGDTYLDPLALLGIGPVRLLPLFGADRT